MLKSYSVINAVALLHMAAKAETAKKAQQLEKLQDLCRSLQLQNRHIKEETVRKRKDMLDTFNDSIKDIKNKCALTLLRQSYSSGCWRNRCTSSRGMQCALRMLWVGSVRHTDKRVESCRVDNSQVLSQESPGREACAAGAAGQHARFSKACWSSTMRQRCASTPPFLGL